MIIQISDWIFDVDISVTMTYSANIWNDHCLCGYCRNFYETVNGAYPQLQAFLKQFGMNSLTPEEMSPIEPTLCMASYCISGVIKKRGTELLDLGGVTLSVASQEESDYDPGCGNPYFVLTTGLLDLPWVLDEDMDEVVSPANEPEYLQRMANRLLGTFDGEAILS